MIFLFCVGCATESSIPVDQVWPDDKYMTRLERDVEELCNSLVPHIKPGLVYVSWQDNLRPHAPILYEEYVVSMFKRQLTHLGFTIITEDNPEAYRLSLIMTPSQKYVLTLAHISYKGKIIATKEAYLVNKSEKWNKALYSYRYRTKIRIPMGNKP